MILADIEAKLQELDRNVYYGMVDESQNETLWDYSVFNRTVLRYNANKTSASDHFDVHIVRENYVPEGLPDEYIRSLCQLEGVRLASNDCEFNYVQKPNTNIVVEMCTIHFVRARKSYA